MGKYRVTTDSGTFEVTTDDSGGIPGMEKLGAPPAAAATPPVEVAPVSRAAVLGLGRGLPPSQQPKPGEPYLGNANDVAGVGLGRAAESAYSLIKNLATNPAARDAAISLIPRGDKLLKLRDALRGGPNPEKLLDPKVARELFPEELGGGTPAPAANVQEAPGPAAAPAQAPVAAPQASVAQSPATQPTPPTSIVGQPATGPLANNPQAFSIAKQLRDSLEASGNGVDTAAESAGNVAKAQAATAKISSSRGAWVDQMAKTLHEAGITSADAAQYIKTPSQLDHMAKVAGVTRPSARSPVTLAQMVESLKRLEAK